MGGTGRSLGGGRRERSGYRTPKDPSHSLPVAFICCFHDSISYSLYFREGSGTPLQYSCLENPMDGGAWWAAVHGVAKSWARLSDFTWAFHFHALEKEMAAHSSVLAWRIPGIEGPSGLLWGRTESDTNEAT